MVEGCGEPQGACPAEMRPEKVRGPLNSAPPAVEEVSQEQHPDLKVPAHLRRPDHLKLKETGKGKARLSSPPAVCLQKDVFPGTTVTQQP